MQDARPASRPRRVVITGASCGIGRATAEAFARQGARLVIAARDADALEEVAGRCRHLGAEAIAVPADVTQADAVAALARRAVAFAGGLDVWVSNVGVGAVGAFHEVPLAAHEQVIRANLIGHMNDAHAAIPIFLRQGHGVFVNMISLAALPPRPLRPPAPPASSGCAALPRRCGASWRPIRTSMSATSIRPSWMRPASRTGRTIRDASCPRRRRRSIRAGWPG